MIAQRASQTTLLRRLSFVMMVLVQLALADGLSRRCPKTHVPMTLAHQASTNKQQVRSRPLLWRPLPPPPVAGAAGLV